MNQITIEVEQHTPCLSHDHYYNLLVDGTCFTCQKLWGLPADTEIDAMYKEAQRRGLVASAEEEHHND